MSRDSHISQTMRLADFLLAGLHVVDIDPEEKRKRVLFLAVIILPPIPVFSSFGIYYLLNSIYIYAVLNLSIASILTGIFIGIRFMKKGLIIYRFTMGSLALLVLYWIKSGAIQGNAGLWLFPFPLILFFLFGKKEGLFWLSIIIVVTFVLLTDPYGILNCYSYSPHYVVRYLGVLILITVFSFYYESTRIQIHNDLEAELQSMSEEKSKLNDSIQKADITNKELEALNIQLTSQMEKRRQMLNELQKAYTDLEIRIKDRTLESERTDQKQHHEIKHRQQTAEELEESETKYRKLVHSINSIILKVGIDGIVTMINEYAQRFYGFTAHEIVGQHALGTILPNTNDSQLFINDLANNILEKPQNYVNIERANIKKSGEEVWVLWTIKAITDTSGNLKEVLCVGNDVTEQKRTRELMIQNEKMMTIGGMAAGMAHEINNPLAGMIQSIQVIKNRLSPELARNENIAEECGISMKAVDLYIHRRGISKKIEMITESGKRASSIVKNMLNFSRKDNQSFKFHNIEELLESAVELASKYYSSNWNFDFRRIHISREYEAHMPQIYCEENMLRQVFLNLLQNGAQAMYDSTSKNRHPQFILRIQQQDEMACIEIEDNGPGIDLVTRDKIFDPFFTTKPIGKGTGLGLSISYIIITNNHLGNMKVASEPGEGTKFIIHLPIHKKRQS